MINHHKFRIADEAFRQYMQAKAPNGEPFRDFEHPLLYKDEIKYKREARDGGKEALQLHRWARWKSETGKILQAIRGACKQEISSNLLEHRYGTKGSSYKSLYLVETQDKINSLELALFDFFLGGGKDPDSFGARFDTFADYLRANRLGCNWAFVAYLSFLLDARRYFPIRPTRFDALLRFYEVPGKIGGHVSWDRYRILLDLAEGLKEKLAIYGPVDAIAVQSYMWVVSYLIKEDKVPAHTPLPQFDYDKELSRRVNSARERERIGLLGERFVFDAEVEGLDHAGRSDLASRVKIVFAEEDGQGFDVLSFTLEGGEIHIEVKTTTRSPTNDNGFWLSNNEKTVAEQDKRWVVYRVWNIDTMPTCENLGNIVRETSEEWELIPSNWYVRSRDPVV